MATKKKRASKPKTKRASKKPKRAMRRTSRKPVVRKPPVPKAPPPPPGPVDFSDEDAVLAEVCRAIDVNVEDAQIRDVSSSHAIGNVSMYEVTVGHGEYPQEYYVVESEDAAHDEAIARVKQDLENEPEIFNQSFIESHIDKEKLRSALESDVQNSNEERLRDERASDFWREAESYGVSPKYIATGNDADGRDIALGTFDDESDADEAAGKWLDEKKESDPENADSYSTDVEASDPSDEDIEQVAEAMTSAELKDPMEYLEGIYGDEAAKHAIEIAGIDIDAAADEAVSADGEGHFLSSYDGNTSETKPSRFVWWRHN